MYRSICELILFPRPEEYPLNGDTTGDEFEEALRREDYEIWDRATFHGVSYGEPDTMDSIIYSARLMELSDGDRLISTINDEELAHWKTINIDGYNTLVRTGIGLLRRLKRSVDESGQLDEKVVDEAHDFFRTKPERLRDRYSEIKIDELGDIFSLEILTRVQERLIPRFVEVSDELCGLLSDYRETSSLDQESFSVTMNRVSNVLNRLGRKGKELLRNPFYDTYYTNHGRELNEQFRRSIDEV